MSRLQNYMCATPSSVPWKHRRESCFPKPPGHRFNDLRFSEYYLFTFHMILKDAKLTFLYSVIMQSFVKWRCMRFPFCVLQQEPVAPDLRPLILLPR